MKAPGKVQSGMRSRGPSVPQATIASRYHTFQAIPEEQKNCAHPLHYAYWRKLVVVPTQDATVNVGKKDFMAHKSVSAEIIKLKPAPDLHLEPVQVLEFEPDPVPVPVPKPSRATPNEMPRIFEVPSPIEIDPPKTYRLPTMVSKEILVKPTATPNLHHATHHELSEIILDVPSMTEDIEYDTAHETEESPQSRVAVLRIVDPPKPSPILKTKGTFTTRTPSPTRESKETSTTQTKPQRIIKPSVPVIIAATGVKYGVQYSSASLNISGVACKKWIEEVFERRYKKGLRIPRAAESSDLSYLSKFGSSMVWTVTIAAFAVGCVVGRLCTWRQTCTGNSRKNLIVVMFVNILGLLLCTLSKKADSYEMLVIGRFVSGISLAYGDRVSKNLIRETIDFDINSLRTVFGAQQLLANGTDAAAFMVALLTTAATTEHWEYSFLGAIIISGLQLLWLFASLYVDEETKKKLPKCFHPCFRYLLKCKMPLKIPKGDDAEKNVLSDPFVVHTLKFGHVDINETNCPCRYPLDSWDCCGRYWNLRKIMAGIITGVLVASISISQIFTAYSVDLFETVGVEHTTSQVSTAASGCVKFMLPFVMKYFMRDSSFRKRILVSFGFATAALIFLSGSAHWASNIGNTISEGVLISAMGAASAILAYVQVNLEEVFTKAQEGSDDQDKNGIEEKTDDASQGPVSTFGVYWLSTSVLLLFYTELKRLFGLALSFAPAAALCLLSALFVYTLNLFPDDKVAAKPSDPASKKRARSASDSQIPPFHGPLPISSA